MGAVAVEFLVDFFAEPRNARMVDELLKEVSPRPVEAVV